MRSNKDCPHPDIIDYSNVAEAPSAIDLDGKASAHLQPIRIHSQQKMWGAGARPADPLLERPVKEALEVQIATATLSLMALGYSQTAAFRIITEGVEGTDSAPNHRIKGLGYTLDRKYDEGRALIPKFYGVEDAAQLFETIKMSFQLDPYKNIPRAKHVAEIVKGLSIFNHAYQRVRPMQSALYKTLSHPRLKNIHEAQKKALAYGRHPAPDGDVAVVFSILAGVRACDVWQSLSFRRHQFRAAVKAGWMQRGKLTELSVLECYVLNAVDKRKDDADLPESYSRGLKYIAGAFSQFADADQLRFSLENIATAAGLLDPAPVSVAELESRSRSHKELRLVCVPDGTVLVTKVKPDREIDSTAYS